MSTRLREGDGVHSAVHLIHRPRSAISFACSRRCLLESWSAAAPEDIASLRCLNSNYDGMSIDASQRIFRRISVVLAVFGTLGFFLSMA